jgi:hypothetical protein
MKPLKLLLIILLSVPLFALSPYVKGYRDYIRYIKYCTGHELKSPYLLQKLGIQTQEELKKDFDNNAKILLQKAEKFNPKVAEGIKKIIKKGDLKDLEVFWAGIVNGKIPPG